jgi:predicted dehydrogenase
MSGGQPLRLGIAGANVERGWARDTHFPALAALPQYVVQAVSARSKDIADTAAAQFGVPTAYADSVAMAQDPAVDVVVVTVKVPEHQAIVKAALEAGKHVYCEWPLARDLAEAQELAALARKAGTHVVIGLQGAYSQAVQQAARLVQQGVIGPLLNLRVISSTAGWGTASPAHYAYLQDKKNGATLETIAGGHTLAMIEEVVGAFTEVSARATTLRKEMQVLGTDEVVIRTCADHLMIHGLHEGGCVSSVEIVGGSLDPLVFELRGKKGTLSIRGDHPGGFQCARLELSINDDPIPPAAPVIKDELEGAPINVANLYESLSRDIGTGNRTCPDFERAVRLTRLLDTIDKASVERRTLPVDQ